MLRHVYPKIYYRVHSWNVILAVDSIKLEHFLLSELSASAGSSAVELSRQLVIFVLYKY
jgi:hypothetical protein